MERLFVEKKIVDKLLTEWKKNLEDTLTFGNPEKCNFGSLVSQVNLLGFVVFLELSD